MFREPALNNTAKMVFIGPKDIQSVNVINPNASVVYLQFWDEFHSNVVVGITVPHKTLKLFASGGYDFAWPKGLRFERAVTIAATENIDGTGSALSSGLLINLD